MRKEIKVSMQRSGGLSIYLTEEAAFYLGGPQAHVRCVFVTETREFVMAREDVAGAVSISLNKDVPSLPYRVVFGPNQEVTKAMTCVFAPEPVAWYTEGKETIRFILPPDDKLTPPKKTFPRAKKQKKAIIPDLLPPNRGIVGEFQNDIRPALLEADRRKRLVEAARTFNELFLTFPGISWTFSPERGLSGKEDVLK